jgi:short-subunit dehydrogenase
VESRLEKLLADVTEGGTQLDYIVFNAGVIEIKPVKEVDVDYLKTAAVVFFAPLLIVILKLEKITC